MTRVVAEDRDEQDLRLELRAVALQNARSFAIVGGVFLALMIAQYALIPIDWASRVLIGFAMGLPALGALLIGLVLFAANVRSPRNTNRIGL